MIVTLVANTELTEEFWTRLQGTEMYKREHPNSFVIGSVWDYDYAADPDLLAEAAGRICYDSFHLPNEKTRKNADYLANIKRQMHFSVLEHTTFTFHIGEVSRCLTHELIRHRHLSPSQESQRYVDVSNNPMVIPAAVYNLPNEVRKVWIAQFETHAARSAELYRGAVSDLMANGASRKEARDAARYLLPQGWATELYMTGNGRAWLEFLSKRDSEHAAEEIRELAGKVRDVLKDAAPGIFQ